MKIVVGFLFGLGAGIAVVYWYVSQPEVQERVLSETILSTPTPMVSENNEGALLY